MNGARILIVEDEFIVARDLEGRLRSLGYVVVGVTAFAEQAIRLTGELRPDLVLMDIRLQGPMDGITATEAIRRDYDIPVVYLTAYADDLTLSRARLTEPFGYVLKPFEERELRTVIEMALYKHQAERRLRASERHYATTLSSIGDAVLSTDAAGHITFLNPVAEALTGWTMAEASGRPFHEVFRILDEETRQPPEGPLDRVLRDGVVVGLGNRTLLVARDGREIPIDDCAAPIRDERGTCTGAVLVFRDVTERRRAQEALRRGEALFKSFMDNCPAVAFIKDQEGRYVYANRPWEEQFQPPRTDWNGKTDLEFWPLETALHFQESDSLVRATGQPIVRQETGRLPNGGLRHWLTIKFPLTNLEGQTVVGGFALDITEKVRLEEQLRQVQKMKAVGQLAGGVAHDFNNLLTAINGYASLLLRGMETDNPWHDSVAEILKAGERAADLTRQLLAFSRKQLLQPRVLDLNQIVTGMQKMLSRLIGEHIELVTELAPEAALVRADPGQLEQVIVNLAVNARDAMPQGGRLTITTAHLKRDDTTKLSHPDEAVGKFIRLTVGDTGLGMTEEVKTRLFEPFFTTKEVGKGTGLGLATVYGIIQQSGGSIEVETALGQGTTFIIQLPAVQELPAAEVPVPSADMPRGTETVLLVEDEEPVRRLAQQVLEMCGYTVLKAEHGDEALAVSARYGGPIHLVIADLILPRMNSQQMVEQLSQARPGVKRLFISGYPSGYVNFLDTAAQTGTLLLKPFTPQQLTRKVREVLDQH